MMRTGIYYLFRCIDDSHIPTLYAQVLVTPIDKWEYLLSRADEMIHEIEKMGGTRRNLQWFWSQVD